MATTRILGIDMGNYHVKTSTGIMFKSVYYPSTYKDEFLSYDKVIIGDNKFTVGDGNFDTESDKSKKRNTLPLLLNALAYSISEENANVKIVVGVPADHHKNTSVKEDIKEQLLGLHVFTHSPKNKGSRQRKFMVEDVIVFPEGIGAYYSIPIDLSNEDVIIIDIGGGTTNIAGFDCGRYVDSTTLLNNGTISVMSDIRTKVSIDYPSSKFVLKDIEKYLAKGFIPMKDKVDTIECRHEIIERYVIAIMDEVKLKFPNYERAKTFVCGGGHSMFSSYLTKYINFTVMENSIFRNADGFGKVGISKWAK